ncbi:amidohydrolase family protein [Nocardioides sp. LHD-245]|uniref:amidohydrolase family protein n=1 Tax=Nocardioides sp. LHD-245 TaxID=3051387 RepID=UPI0027E01951|nr:amidohydrolase family protein [Nocardioides sp. LHD-245]
MSTPAPRHESTLIRCGTLIDGTGGPPAREVGVLVRDGRIAEVRPLGQDPPAAQVIVDATSSTLTPGLVDAHTHPAWSTDTDPSEWDACRSTPEGLFSWCVAALSSAAAAGVTTVRDCGSPTGVLVEVRRALERGTIRGPRLVVSGPCITTTAGHADFIGMTADDVADVVRTVRGLCALGVDHIKVMAAGGDMDPHTNRRMPQYSTAELQALVAEASRLSLPVTAHATCTEAIRRSVEAGVHTLAHCNWLGAEIGTIDYSPAVAQLILDQGTYIDLDLPNSFADYAERDGEEFVRTGSPGLARSRWQLHREIRDRGGRIFFSSDEFGRKIGSFPALLLGAVRTGEVSVTEAIHRATAVPAGAVMPSLDIGTVSVGQVADLALFSGDLAADPTGLIDCEASWSGGHRLQVTDELTARTTTTRPTGRPVSPAGAPHGSSERP